MVFAVNSLNTSISWFFAEETVCECRSKDDQWGFSEVASGNTDYSH